MSTNKYLSPIIVFLALLAATIVSCESKAESLTVGLVGMTYHGFGYDKRYGKDMVRRLSSDGGYVWQPELAVTYKTDDLVVYNVSLVDDCFGHGALNLSVGKSTQVTENLSLSALIGFYARRTPPLPYGTYNEDLPTAFRHAINIDTVLMPWAAAQYNVPFTDKTAVSLQVATNLMITHAILGFKFDY